MPTPPDDEIYEGGSNSGQAIVDTDNNINL